MPINLAEITFKAGPSPSDANQLKIQLGSILILVGPNNSGKSLALREIEDWCHGRNPTTKVISDLNIRVPTDPDETIQLLKAFETNPPEGQIASAGNFWVGLHTFRTDKPNLKFQINENGLRQATTNNDLNQILPQVVSLFTARLDGKTRFALSNDQATGDLKKTAENHLWALFQNDAAREKVRQLTKEAFNLYFTIDPTLMTKFSIQLSENPPTNTLEEQALDATSRTYHSSALHISEFSDGVQAFVGLISAVLSLEHKIMLIDEPEAFLHPTLSYILGSNMAEIAEKRDASLVVATHSPAFLMATIMKTSRVSVVRLTYNKKTATARELSSQDLRTMMQDPLLRSTKTLEALFHSAVVVTESDTDRAFYDEINNRLTAENRGIAQCLFLNGQNKQTISRILSPLRKIGVPVAGVVDLDILNSDDTTWNKLISTIGASSEPCFSTAVRTGIINEFENEPLKSRNALHKGGISTLTSTKSEAETFLQKLDEYGLFVVPNGELETWLNHLGIGGHGPEWLVKIFSKLGSDADDASYVKPSSDDVWNFLDKISKWTSNPNRKGT